MLREVAALERERPATKWLARIWQGWLRTPGMALAAVTLLAVGGAGVSLKQWRSPGTTVVVARPEPAATVSPEAVAEVQSEPVVTAQDVEVIADLDNVLSREESRLWTEDDTARF